MNASPTISLVVAESGSVQGRLSLRMKGGGFIYEAVQAAGFQESDKVNLAARAGTIKAVVTKPNQHSGLTFRTEDGLTLNTVLSKAGFKAGDEVTVALTGRAPSTAVAIAAAAGRFGINPADLQTFPYPRTPGSDKAVHEREWLQGGPIGHCPACGSLGIEELHFAGDPDICFYCSDTTCKTIQNSRERAERTRWNLTKPEEMRRREKSEGWSWNKEHWPDQTFPIAAPIV